MSYVVRARIRSGAERIESKRFKTRKAAQKFADATNRDRSGSNARVVKKKRK